MKKIVLFLIALIFSLGVVYAQTTGEIVGEGAIWTDSLGYTNLDEDSDSVWVYDMKFAYNWYKIFVEGNANSPVDSFYFRTGSIRYTEAKVETDTVWGSWTPVQDSLFNSIHTMINNSVGKDFLVYTPVAQLVELVLLNTRADLDTRTLVFTIQALKR